MDDFWAGAIYNAVNSEGKSVIDLAHHVIWQAKVAPLAASMLGLLVSWFMYIVKPDLPKTLATDFQFFYRFLFKKWYFDEIYNAVFLSNYKRISAFFAKKFDYSVIDNIICGLPVWKVKKLGSFAGAFHSGYLYHYAYVMFAGVALMLFFIVIGGI